MTTKTFLSLTWRRSLGEVDPLLPARVVSRQILSKAGFPRGGTVASATLTTDCSFSGLTRLQAPSGTDWHIRFWAHAHPQHPQYSNLAAFGN